MKIHFMHNYVYHFYVNDQLVIRHDGWPAFFGTYLEIRTSADVKIEIDYIKVTRP